MNKFFSVALLLVLTLGTIRGGATSISKVITINDVPPLGYALWQSFIAATILIFLGYRQNKQFPKIGRRIKYYLVCGLVGTALPNTIFFYSIKEIPAGTMAVLLTLVPILTYFLVVVSRMERVDIIRLAGILLGFTGASLIALPRVAGDFQIDTYVLIAMLCPLGYALMGVFVSRQSMPGIHPFHLAAGTHVVAILFLLPITLISGQFHPIWQNPGLPEGLMLIHGTLAAISYSLFFKIVELAGAVFYSFSHYVIALTGLAWGMILFDETHGASFWMAVLLIFGGLTLVNARQHAYRKQLVS